MNRETVGFEASARLDGKPFSNGERVSIGSHTLSITHPKTKPFTTNLFIWYGERNLQAIHLQRAKGTLAVAASPAAKLISISGPEYSVVLTNVMEYKKERSVGFDGGLSVNTSFVPLHESTVKELTETMKAQIAEGKRIVEERIQAVVGQK